MDSQCGGTASDEDEDTLHEWEDADKHSHTVPTEVYNALQAPFRGQSNFGTQHKYLLSLFHDTPEFSQTLDTEKTCKRNVRTILTCKYDSTVKTNVAFQKINTGKLLNKVISCASVPDDVKLKLTEKSTAENCKEWRRQYI